MNTSRIEVPLTLPPPHFDDERTIATARQVEPIGRAKITDTWRKLRTLLPLLFLATLCGGLGAAAVNYYDRKQNEAVVAAPSSQTNSLATSQPKVAPTPLAVAASGEVNGSKPVSENKAVEVEQRTKPDDQLSAPQPKSTLDEKSANPASAPQKKGDDADAAKLTRKRRVQPAEDGPPRAPKNGAARISDIFGGPNP